MIRAADLLTHVVKPTLVYLEMDSPAARALLLGTAAQESWLGHFLVQKNGPALGIYQMEPETHDDIWQNWLHYRWHLRKKVLDMTPEFTRHGWARKPPAQVVIGNLCYATAMARLHYRRVPEPLPEWNDVEGLARYWKEHYNTEAGRGTVKEFKLNFDTRVISKIPNFR